MFESDYAPHVGEVERLAGKKVRRLFVTLPHNYHDWLVGPQIINNVIKFPKKISKSKHQEIDCCIIF